jgi:hypothetical protein
VAEQLRSAMRQQAQPKTATWSSFSKIRQSATLGRWHPWLWSSSWTAASPRHHAAARWRGAVLSTAPSRGPSARRPLMEQGFRSGCSLLLPADHDSPLLAPTLDTLSASALPAGETTVHLDRGYDSLITRAELDRGGLAACVTKRGTPAPIQATTRWVVERTNAWHNAFRKLACCTERRGVVIRFYLALVNTVIIVRRLLREASLPTTDLGPHGRSVSLAVDETRMSCGYSVGGTLAEALRGTSRQTDRVRASARRSSQRCARSRPRCGAPTSAADKGAIGAAQGAPMRRRRRRSPPWCPWRRRS